MVVIDGTSLRRQESLPLDPESEKAVREATTRTLTSERARRGGIVRGSQLVDPAVAPAQVGRNLSEIYYENGYIDVQLPRGEGYVTAYRLGILIVLSGQVRHPYPPPVEEAWTTKNAFTLPEGFRPLTTIIQPTTSFNPATPDAFPSQTWIKIRPDGKVHVTGSYPSLEGVSFVAADVHIATAEGSE